MQPKEGAHNTSICIIKGNMYSFVLLHLVPRDMMRTHTQAYVRYFGPHKKRDGLAYIGHIGSCLVCLMLEGELARFP